MPRGQNRDIFFSSSAESLSREGYAATGVQDTADSSGVPSRVRSTTTSKAERTLRLTMHSSVRQQSEQFPQLGNCYKRRGRRCLGCSRCLMTWSYKQFDYYSRLRLCTRPEICARSWPFTLLN